MLVGYWRGQRANFARLVGISLLCSVNPARAGETDGAPRQIWSPQGPALGPEQPDLLDSFGEALAISGDTLVVGDSRRTVNGAKNQGQVEVFVRVARTWHRQAVLSSPSAAPNASFGRSVALDHDTLLVGSAGTSSARSFVRSGEQWTVAGAEMSAAGRHEYDDFAQSLALSGDRALIGDAWSPDDGLTPAGAAYSFARLGEQWQGSRLTLPAPTEAVSFGTAVAISGSTAVVTASEVSGATPHVGSAFVFVDHGAGWTLQGSPLNDPKFGKPGQAGKHVAISGDTLLMSVRRPDTHPSSLDARVTGYDGACVFARQGSAWAEQGDALEIFDANYEVGDQPTVAIAQNTLALAVAGEPESSIYLFQRVGERWMSSGPPLSVPAASNTVPIALSEHTLVVGNPNVGQVFVFTDGPCRIDTDCPSGATCFSSTCVADTGKGSETDCAGAGGEPGEASDAASVGPAGGCSAADPRSCALARAGAESVRDTESERADTSGADRSVAACGCRLIETPRSRWQWLFLAAVGYLLRTRRRQHAA